MSPVVLAGLWLALGVLSTASSKLLKQHYVPALAVFVGGIAALAVTTGTTAGAGGGGQAWVLDREGAGLLVVAGVATSVALLIGPAAGEGGILIGVVGAAIVLALSAANPLFWGAAMLAASFGLGLRWLATSPGKHTLAGARVAVLGAAVFVATAPFLPVANAQSVPWSVLAGSMLAGATAALLALVPIGGWAVAATRHLPPAELAVWMLLIVPAVLIGVEQFGVALTPTAQTMLDRYLLMGGLLSAVWGGYHALRADGATRFARIFLADVGLCAAGLGSAGKPGADGCLILILVHLTVAPLLVHQPRPGLRWARWTAWLTLTGIPPLPTFWGRFLVVEGCFASGALPGLLAVFAIALLTGTALRHLRSTEPAGDLAAAGWVARGAAWSMSLIAVAVGLIPAAAVHLVFAARVGP